MRKGLCIPSASRNWKWLAGFGAVGYVIVFSALWEVWGWLDWIGFFAGVAVVLGVVFAAKRAFGSKTPVVSDASITRKCPPGMTTTFFICGLYLFSGVSSTVRPTTDSVGAIFPLAFVLLAICIKDFVRIFTQWKQYRYRTLIPFAACIVVVVLGREVSGRLDKALFWHWRLPGYEATILKIESGSIAVSGEGRELSPNEYDRRLALNVWAERDDKGSLIVTFLYGDTGAVGLHDAFVYCESGEVSAHVDRRWRWKSRLNDKWFQVES
jgi:hypothetical protein